MKQVSRKEFLKGFARGGTLASIVGLCAVLASRAEKLECNSRCGRCSKFNDGKCSLGIK